MARLMDEIKQTKPFATLEEHTFLELVLTTERLGAAAARELKAFSLTPAQYNVLRILRGAGETGVTCGEIAERIIQRDPDITRLLDRLVEQGLARRERDERDRRVVVTRATEAARDLLKKVDPKMEAVHKRALGHLGARKLRQLGQLLEEARDAAS